MKYHRDIFSMNMRDMKKLLKIQFQIYRMFFKHLLIV